MRFVLIFQKAQFKIQFNALSTFLHFTEFSSVLDRRLASPCRRLEIFSTLSFGMKTECESRKWRNGKIFTQFASVLVKSYFYQLQQWGILSKKKIWKRGIWEGQDWAIGYRAKCF